MIEVFEETSSKNPMLFEENGYLTKINSFNSRKLHGKIKHETPVQLPNLQIMTLNSNKKLSSYEELKNLFTHLDESTINNALDINQNSVDKSIQYLIEYENRDRTASNKFKGLNIEELLEENLQLGSIQNIILPIKNYKFKQNKPVLNKNKLLENEMLIDSVEVFPQVLVTNQAIISDPLKNKPKLKIKTQQEIDSLLASVKTSKFRKNENIDLLDSNSDHIDSNASHSLDDKILQIRKASKVLNYCKFSNKLEKTFFDLLEHLLKSSLDPHKYFREQNSRYNIKLSNIKESIISLFGKINEIKFKKDEMEKLIEENEKAEDENYKLKSRVNFLNEKLAFYLKDSSIKFDLGINDQFK